MGLENDTELKKLEEELQRERERVARLEREVKEKMRQQGQKNLQGKTARSVTPAFALHL